MISYHTWDLSSTWYHTQAYTRALAQTWAFAEIPIGLSYLHSTGHQMGTTSRPSGKGQFDRLCASPPLRGSQRT
jgi:hypothetical protein